MAPTTDLGATLRSLRRKRGLSLDDASRRGGASKAALSAWENNLRSPRGPALARLLEAYEADDRTKARLVVLADPRHARIVLAGSPFGPVDAGTVLRAMRERRGIAQTDLAQKIGVSQSAISRWESGDDVPSAESLHALGFALGASPEETLALASAVGHGITDLSDDPEAAIAQIWAGNHYHSLRGLILLGWEAELVRRAARDRRWDIPLASVLSARACFLLVEGRDAEIAGVAKRTLRLSNTLDVRLQAVPALGTLDHALRRMGKDDSETTEMAETWSGKLPDSSSRAWMLRQHGQALIRRGRTAEGLRWIERSSDVELAARPDHPEPWSHRAEMLADAHLMAGDPCAAAAAVDGRRERCFPPKLFVRIEHANGRAVSEAEMAWLRWRTHGERWPDGLAGSVEIGEVEREVPVSPSWQRSISSIPARPSGQRS
ncbi:transcriptional regulator, partial [bacterium]